ncbi:MAG: hypothetical protein PHV87_00800 [Bacilli bacterium]|nr:hypothetical protein [Bacilli bacterium]
MVVLCIDLKSFYASVECVLRGLNPFTTDLAVADERRGRGSIVLAVSPHLKKSGVSSRCRLYQLPNKDIIVARPQMKKYIEYSCKVYEIYLRYVAKEDIHVYSIDEAFLDLTHYLKYYNAAPLEICQRILKDIYNGTGLTATCGIGDNMFLAKVALDCLAKYRSDNIAYLDQNLFYQYIWDIRPLNNIWGIGGRLVKRLAALDIYSLRDLASTSPEILEKEFGILGLELYQHAHGKDATTVRAARSYHPKSKTFGHGQVLLEDYNYKDIRVIMVELAAEIATELVLRRLCCQEIALGIGYSKKYGGGFYRQMKLDKKTNSYKTLLTAFEKIYVNNIKDLPIRNISLRVGKLSNEEFIQSTLFTDTQNEIKERNLYRAIGEIREKHGKTAVRLAVSNTEKATLVKRSILIGGHNAE